MIRLKQIIGLTGVSGSGKTQLCQKAICYANEKGFDVSGFFCPAIFIGDTKVAINVIILPLGNEKSLAMLAKPGMNNNVYGKWDFNQKTIEDVVTHFLSISKCDLLIIDELGPLEIEEKKGWHKVLQHIDQIDYSVLIITFRSRYQKYFEGKFSDILIIDLDNKYDVQKFQHTFEKFLIKGGITQ